MSETTTSDPMLKPDGHRYEAPESRRTRDDKEWSYAVLGLPGDGARGAGRRPAPCRSTQGASNERTPEGQSRRRTAGRRRRRGPGRCSPCSLSFSSIAAVTTVTGTSRPVEAPARAGRSPRARRAGRSR